MKSLVSKFWRGPGGAADVLRIALPLILSTSAFTIQMFIDRMFLMWHSSAAMSAAAYGGIVNFTFFSFFLGTVTYVNTFVAQYDGAGQKRRIGASVWQGVYFSVSAGVIMASFSFLAEPIVNIAGHEAALRQYEAVYFRILCIGAMPGLLAATLSCFFTGRCKTWTVMWVNVAATVVNIALDYCLIFGHWFFPKWGTAGAAAATVASSLFSCVVYLFLFFGQKHRRRYSTVSGWRFDGKLFLRMMRYGLPSGTQFMLDILGFTLFVTFIGRISATCLAASSMAFQINSLAFMPMIGFNVAVSVLVGRALGENKPALAQRSTWSASTITLFYMTTIAAGYWFFPGVFMYPFAVQADPAEFGAIKGTVETLLCFVAIYSVFDTGTLIFSAALKGAGDTRFVMVASVSLNWLIMVVPTYIAVTLQKSMAGFYLAWTALTVYVIVLAVLFLIRFLQGKWKNMRVIEAAPTPLPHNMPAVPTVETDKN